VLIFDGHLWHSGRGNTSGARRRVVQMTATRSSGPAAV
jgi:ectoine hydroxylase-related dioxygenase (phytanoyl-CoA dioxygenase family)